MIEPLSKAQHWSTAESLAGAAAVWGCNPAGHVSIMPPFSVLEKERNEYYLVLVSRNWFSLVNLWKDKASHRRRAKDPNL